jgi:hypothetical protein
MMALDDAFGPPPLVLPFKFGAIVVHLPWLAALILIGAGGTLLARRAGANLGERVFVALSPALVIGGAVNLLMAIVVIAAKAGGHRVHPVDFIGHFVIGWLVFPAASLFFGSFLFLKGPSGHGQSA